MGSDGWISTLWSSIKRDPLSTPPLIAAVVAGVLLVVDFLPFVDLPSGYGDEVVLLAAALTLMGSYVMADKRNRQDRRHRVLLDRVEHLVSTTGVRQVPSGDIAEMLDRELKSSTSWSFRGGSGRWLRRDVLPFMATHTDVTVDVRIQLLDPRDEFLCQQYAEFRSTQRDPSDRRPDERNPRTIQTDILASIFAAMSYSLRSRISPEIVLLRNYSPLRVDAGNNSLLITVASRKAPGVLASCTSFFYKSTLDELKSARHGNAQVVLRRAGIVAPDPAGATGTQAQEILKACVVRQFNGAADEPLLQGYAGESGLDFDEIARCAFHVEARF